MGVDLRLLPSLLGEINPRFLCAHEIWSVERRNELWDDIHNLQQLPIPAPLACFLASDKTSGETCYGNVETTPYGDPVTYTTVADLLTLIGHESVQDNWRNRAIWAALREFPTYWPVFLWWH